MSQICLCNYIERTSDVCLCSDDELLSHDNFFQNIILYLGIPYEYTMVQYGYAIDIDEYYIMVRMFENSNKRLKYNYTKYILYLTEKVSTIELRELRLVYIIYIFMLLDTNYINEFIVSSNKYFKTIVDDKIADFSIIVQDDLTIYIKNIFEPKKKYVYKPKNKAHRHKLFRIYLKYSIFFIQIYNTYIEKIYAPGGTEYMNVMARFNNNIKKFSPKIN